MRHELNIVQAGKALNEANKALIMIHGRGGTAEDILGLSAHLNTEDFALLAPQATHHTWYPHSFMAPTESNEPGLSSALDTVKATVKMVEDAGIASENTYFFG
ncbi:MAG TPA: phospholipase, partial [Sphingobacteriaceae bacterium]|nr:phospholipase [Sphingobacteriaceae bacterium]